MEMTRIRYYKSQDFSHLIHILKLANLYHAPTDTKKVITKQIRYDPKSIIVAEDKGGIVGSIFVMYSPWASMLYHLAVHPDYQKKGLGTRLMDKAESMLKRRGMPQPTLLVEKNNKKAIDFYKKRKWFVLAEVLCMEKKL